MLESPFLGISSDPSRSSPRKFAVIDVELTHLLVSITALSETWLTGSGSIREGNFTIFWNGYPEGKRPLHGMGFAVHNKLLGSTKNP